MKTLMCLSLLLTVSARGFQNAEQNSTRLEVEVEIDTTEQTDEENGSDSSTFQTNDDVSTKESETVEPKTDEVKTLP